MLTGEQILELQTLVRKVPVTDHVIQYTLALVRQTRVGEPGVPKFIKDWLCWGAGPRAVQNLILGGKARALLYGRVARHDRGHPGAGLPGAAAPHPDELHRRLRRRHHRRGRRAACSKRRPSKEGELTKDERFKKIFAS